MKTSELTSALLDYWVARAEGVQGKLHLGPFDGVEYACWIKPESGENEIYWPSLDWAQGGPLIEKYRVDLEPMAAPVFWRAELFVPGPRILSGNFYSEDGSTPLEAICRAVVRAKFGDEVEEV